MKTSVLSLVLLAVIAAFAMVPMFDGSILRAQESKDTTVSLHKSWEYRALRIGDRNRSGTLNRDIGARHSESEDTLNLLGAEGWELLTVRSDGPGEPVFYFKRLLLD
jgi:hypothetical protein